MSEKDMSEKERIVDMIGYLLKRLVELDDEETEKDPPVEKKPPVIMYEANAPTVYCPRCLERAVTLSDTGEKLGGYRLGYCPACKKRFPISKYKFGDPMYMSSAEMMACDMALWRQSDGRLGKNWGAASNE